MDVLRALYHDIIPLKSWLCKALTLAKDSQATDLILQDDPQRILLTTVYVGSSDNLKIPCFTSSQHSTLKEIVLRAIERNLKKKSAVQNVLCLGYSLRSTDMGAQTGEGDVEIVYPNSCIRRLLSRPWQILHDRIGDTALLFLLQNLSLFLEVPPSCFVQLTGVPVYSSLADKPTAISRGLKHTGQKEPTKTTAGRKVQKRKGPQQTKRSIKNQARTNDHGHEKVNSDTKNKLVSIGNPRKRKFEKTDDLKYDKLRELAEAFAKRGRVESDNYSRTCEAEVKSVTSIEGSRIDKKLCHGASQTLAKAPVVQMNPIKEASNRKSLKRRLIDTDDDLGETDRGKSPAQKRQKSSHTRPLSPENTSVTCDGRKDTTINVEVVRSSTSKISQTHTSLGNLACTGSDLNAAETTGPLPRETGPDCTDKGGLSKSGDETSKYKHESKLSRVTGKRKDAEAKCATSVNTVEEFVEAAEENDERNRDKNSGTGEPRQGEGNRNNEQRRRTLHRRSFKPFEWGLALPRHSYMYRKNPREAISRYDLLQHLTLDADSLLTLYNAIFVDTKVLPSSRETIHVVPPSLEECVAILDQRHLPKVPEATISETSQVNNSRNESVDNTRSRCGNGRPGECRDFDNLGCISGLSNLHSSFGHDTHLLNCCSRGSNKSDISHTADITNAGTGQNSAENNNHTADQTGPVSKAATFVSATRLHHVGDTTVKVCREGHKDGKVSLSKENLLQQRKAALLSSISGNIRYSLSHDIVGTNREKVKDLPMEIESSPSQSSVAHTLTSVGNNEVTNKEMEQIDRRDTEGDESATTKIEAKQSKDNSVVGDSSENIQMECSEARDDTSEHVASSSIFSNSAVAVEFEKMDEGDEAKKAPVADLEKVDVEDTEKKETTARLEKTDAEDTEMDVATAECAKVEDGAKEKKAAAAGLNKVVREDTSENGSGKGADAVDDKSVTDGDSDCSLGAVRIPPCRDVMLLLAEFIARHRKCPYKSFLNQLSPFLCQKKKSPRSRNKGIADASVPALLQKHTAPRQVFLFLRRCLLKTVPLELFGCVKNRNIVLKNLSRMLRAGRFDKLCLGQLMSGIKTKALPWLACCHSNSVKLHLLAKLVLWVFTKYLFMLIKSYFYVTDTTFLKYRMLYYRQALWTRIQYHGIMGLIKQKTLKSIAEKEATQWVVTEQSLGVSALRFLPKEKSLRPIVNMGFTDKQITDKTMSVNQQLFSVYQILSYVKERNPSLLGYGKLGTNEIYRAWSEFCEKWRSLDQPRLFFVKTDISRCYDSIIQTKLYEILEDVLKKELSDDELIVRKYMVTRASRGTVKTKFIRQVDALPTFDGDFVSFARDLVKRRQLKNGILMDKVVYQHETLDSVLETLHKHLFHNSIKVGSQYYRQCCGISQGSLVSTVLCGFYYADMERNFLTVAPDDFLMRIVDDYMYISPSLERAEGFLKQLVAGFPQYNCQTNVEKVLTSFPCHDFSAVTSDWFPWCGLMFNTRTLDVAVDYSRLRGVSIEDTMAYDLSNHPGATLQRKILFSACQKCHPIFLDGLINSRQRVLRNAYLVFLLAAFKLHSYIRKLPHTHRAQQNTAFFLGVLQCLASCVYWHYQKAQRHEPSDLQLSDSRESIQWLCYKAFLQRLQRFPSQYSAMLKKIKGKKSALERKLGTEMVDELKNVTGDDLPADFRLIL